MMWGEYTRLMSVRERTSIDEPRALSGSNALMTWPGVASTRTVAGTAATDWENAGVARAVNEKHASRKPSHAPRPAPLMRRTTYGLGPGFWGSAAGWPYANANGPR